jgi:hypothetical protein
VDLIPLASLKGNILDHCQFANYAMLLYQFILNVSSGGDVG